jgi:hypothetical protein
VIPAKLRPAFFGAAGITDPGYNGIFSKIKIVFVRQGR